MGGRDRWAVYGLPGSWKGSGLPGHEVKIAGRQPGMVFVPFTVARDFPHAFSQIVLLLGFLSFPNQHSVSIDNIALRAASPGFCGSLQSIFAIKFDIAFFSSWKLARIWAACPPPSNIDAISCYVRISRHCCTSAIEIACSNTRTKSGVIGRSTASGIAGLGVCACSA